ncbi:MAG: helix-turn-helix transcriptional regulator [Chloroflexi bacterium]|nr:helix-turn-helix transcriptional regulator [Chloroflexota bacterium]
MATKLKDARTAKGLSQLALARKARMAPSDVSRIENGWLHPYPDWRKRLAKALGVAEKELFPEEAANAGK